MLEKNDTSPPSPSSSQTAKPKQNTLFRRFSNHNNVESEDVSIGFDLFMHICSIKNWYNYLQMFLVISNSYHSLHSDDFDKDIIIVKDCLYDLYSSTYIPKRCKEIYEELINEYYDYETKKKTSKLDKLISNIWADLIVDVFEGEKKFENQLKQLGNFQKNRLRKLMLGKLSNLTRQISSNYRTKRKKEQLQDKINDLNAEISDLNKQNSQYQAALGEVKNVRWGDDTPNNPTKLAEAFIDLQSTLEDFTLVQGEDYEINVSESSGLLNHLNCKEKLSSIQGKLVLSAIFQRRIIEIVLREIHSCFIPSTEPEIAKNSDETLEVDIVNAADVLIRLTKKFADSRSGNDDITRMVSIKVRQQVYAALGVRGLSDPNHPFIKKISTKLVTYLSRYRQIRNEELNSDLEEQAIKITQEIINLFCFKSKAQPIIPEYEFFESGQAVDVRYMQGFLRKEDPKKLEVEICSFPLISIPGDDKNKRVLIKAHVITRKKNSS
ncbi:2865_t:CDS:1 [Diversispora eburnea]|uniref:2865_t:CDS:1 n=1 Tax=Diversispora eburnea TaxID=1213867 RepID=A0A9N9FP42_9GLOM|nr:2865_t:CDS:1 [Diversispora eburnea]